MRRREGDKDLGKENAPEISFVCMSITDMGLVTFSMQQSQSVPLELRSNEPLSSIGPFLQFLFSFSLPL